MSFLLRYLLGAGLVLFTFMANAQQPAELPVDSFEKAITAPAVQILDVRTVGEFKAGHLRNSLWADWNDREQFEERAASLDKSRPVYTYCLSGGRSAAAAAWLRERGYTVYKMAGGIAEWKKAGKILEGRKDAPQLSMTAYLAMIPPGKTVLVDFGAPWCPPCVRMKPVVDSLLREEGSSVVFVPVDGGEQAALGKELGVESLPTFIIYKDGRESWRKQGIVTAVELKEHL
ncbi:MAG TPA: thioredoxin domain-containing protein [Chitinophagaceae bacterium]|nr:thioredoxin domain-containing protein [Chitinophagaceae bacterium]